MLRSELGSIAIYPLIAAAITLAGCSARCERVCDKLLACGEEGVLSTDRFSHAECEDSCLRQEDLFVGWEDEDELQEAYDEHRSCIVKSSCEEIAQGVCYDDRFFIVGP